MIITEAVPDITSRSLFLSWGSAPPDTLMFRVYRLKRGAGADEVAGLTEKAVLIGETTDTFFSDIFYFDELDEEGDLRYRIDALSQITEARPLDTAVISPLDNYTPELAPFINSAEMAANIVFRNRKWSDTAYVLRPRTTGKHCGCYSPDRGRGKDPDCEKCYGTGFAGGFYTPIPVRYSEIRREKLRREIDEQSPQARDIPLLAVPSTPQIRETDFLATNVYGILSVAKADTTVVRGVRMPTTLLTAVKLNKNSVINRFPITAVSPVVTGITTGQNTLTVTGRNLVNVSGTIQLYLTTLDSLSEYASFGPSDLLSTSAYRLVFRGTFKGCTSPSVKYMLFINNIPVEGIIHS